MKPTIPLPQKQYSAIFSICPCIHCFWLYVQQIPDVRAFHLEIFLSVSKT